MLLNDEWKDLLRRYRAEHSHPLCRKAHLVGMPLLAVGFATLAIPPVSLPLLAAGGGLLLVGHRVQGNRPMFESDKRATVVGAIWWLDTVLRPTGLGERLFG